MKTHDYLFDVKLFASIRVDATSVKEARAKLATMLDCASVSVPDPESNDPIVFEASLDDDPPDLIEVDGEATW